MTFRGPSMVGSLQPEDGGFIPSRCLHRWCRNSTPGNSTIDFLPALFHEGGNPGFAPKQQPAMATLSSNHRFRGMTGQSWNLRIAPYPAKYPSRRFSIVQNKSLVNRYSYVKNKFMRPARKVGQTTVARIPRLLFGNQSSTAPLARYYGPLVVGYLIASRKKVRLNQAQSGQK